MLYHCLISLLITLYFPPSLLMRVIQKEAEQYTISDQDEREVIQRAIKLRRGQQNFRKELLKIQQHMCNYRL